MGVYTHIYEELGAQKTRKAGGLKRDLPAVPFAQRPLLRRRHMSNLDIRVQKGEEGRTRKKTKKQHTSYWIRILNLSKKSYEESLFFLAKIQDGKHKRKILSHQFFAI